MAPGFHLTTALVKYTVGNGALKENIMEYKKALYRFTAVLDNYAVDGVFISTEAEIETLIGRKLFIHSIPFVVTTDSIATLANLPSVVETFETHVGCAGLNPFDCEWDNGNGW